MPAGSALNRIYSGTVIDKDAALAAADLAAFASDVVDDVRLVDNRRVVDNHVVPMNRLMKTVNAHKQEERRRDDEA